MSYEIVSKIEVLDNKVFLTTAANNVRPRTPTRWECQALSNILQEKGIDALDIAILMEYETGNLQGGSNRYTRALTVLLHLPEYKNFDWRNNTGNENRKSLAFIELLKKALNSKLPKSKYIVFYQDGYSQAVFLKRLYPKKSKWTYDQKEAKTFRFEKDAEYCKQLFSKQWNTEVGQLS